VHCQWGEKPLPGDRCCGLLSEEARATAIGNMHKKFGKDRAWVLEISYQTVRQSDRQAGGFVWPDCAPSSERPQFGMPPGFDRSTTPHRRFNYNILASVVLLQQCHCQNRHRGKLQNVSPPSVLFESSRNFFTIQRRHRRKKMINQNFEIQIL